MRSRHRKNNKCKQSDDAQSRPNKYTNVNTVRLSGSETRKTSTALDPGNVGQLKFEIVFQHIIPN